MKKVKPLLLKDFKIKLFDYPPTDKWNGKPVKIPTVGDIVVNSLDDFFSNKWEKDDSEHWYGSKK